MARDVRSDSHSLSRDTGSLRGQNEPRASRDAPQFGSPEYERMMRGLADSESVPPVRRKPHANRKLTGRGDAQGSAPLNAASDADATVPPARGSAGGSRGSAAPRGGVARRSVWERLGLVDAVRDDPTAATARDGSSRGRRDDATGVMTGGTRKGDGTGPRGRRDDAAQRHSFRPDGGNPRTPWWRRVASVGRHCFDKVDDTQAPAISTARYTGVRFLLNPVYCYFGFVASAVALTVLGLVMVYSSSSVELVSAGASPLSAAVQQLKFIAIGLVLLVVFMLGTEKFHRCVIWVFSGLALLLQVYTVLFGVEFQGNRSWATILGVQFQPAELLKLALCAILPILVFASRRSVDRWQLVNWSMPIAASLLAIGLVALGSKDMGTSLVFLTICVGVLIAGGLPGRLIRGGFLLLIVGGGVILALNSSRISRIKMLFQGCTASGTDLQGDCYQIIHGIYALSTGGLSGVGLGNSYEKWNYLPEAESDFIFAVIGEELGFVGAMFVIVLFVLMGWCLVVMALNHPHAMGCLTMLAVFFWIIPQAVINIAVVVEMFPVTGLPLPFLSSGGSSLICCLGACGLVCYEARRIPAIHDAIAR